MKSTITILAAVFGLTSASYAQDFNNWTTESLKKIFIPPTHITRVRGQIKTVTFPFRPKDEKGYPTRIYAWECFNLVMLFVNGPNADYSHTHNTESPIIDGKITETDLETGYTVTRDREVDFVTMDREAADLKDLSFDPHAVCRYHFTVTKNDTIILTAELIEPEKLGPRFVLHITAAK